MKKIIFITLLLITAFATSVSSQEADSTYVVSLRDTISDNNMVIIESLEYENDTILSNWYLQKFTNIDSTCIASGENIEYSDSVYIERLSKLPTLIDMPYNSIIKEYITLYAAKRRKLVESLLGFGIYYFPIFEEALEREGLPMELKYLPVIESALRPNAVSKAGASGLWQIMPKTAKGLGLEVNSLVDERRSPIASSDAAAKYLKELYNIYNDWSLAIAAYNCGPGNVNKAIVRSGGKKDFWGIYHHLPRETRGYVPAFIAANYIMTYYEEHNICPVAAEIPLATDTIVINERINLQQISAVLNTPIEMLRELNPQYRNDIIPGNIKPYHLRLPIQLTYAYINSQDSIINYRQEYFARQKTVEPAKLEYGYHKIRNGESLSSIAKKYHTTVTKLKELNGLKNNNIRAGQNIKVPGAGNSNLSSGGSGSTKSHKVKSGETLASIASRYGVNVNTLKNINGLNSNLIRIGQVLKIPAK
ncbi:MAG: LysM peptidoglycan-binding domain-containing protein [Muribaculaceae bacterium]|nr:LysM peptidoglycan-binding domain-containing protein [Muribaculaceae bacterium]